MSSTSFPSVSTHHCSPLSLPPALFSILNNRSKSSMTFDDKCPECAKNLSSRVAASQQPLLSSCLPLKRPLSTRCLKITEKVSFNIQASYVYILSGQKFIKNAKNGPFWRCFENLKLAVKQCYQTGQF